MQDFFDKYPEIYSSCKEVNTYINTSLSGISINENEISFDHLIPFIFQEIPESKKMDISIALRLGREIIDYYNKNKMDVKPFMSLLDNYFTEHFITYKEYQQANSKLRHYQFNDVIKSYTASTIRVSYRNTIITFFSKKNNFDLNDSFFNQLNILSAFFLYDDDVCDFEDDIENRKQTILSDYVINHNGDILVSNSDFVDKLNTLKILNAKNEKLTNFIETFKKIYQ